MCQLFVFRTSETYLGFSKLQFSPQFTPSLIGCLTQIVPEPAAQGCLFFVLPPLEDFFSFIGVSPFSCLGRQGISTGDTLFLSQPQFSTRNVTAQDYPGQFK
jgi:hypothetical protein